MRRSQILLMPALFGLTLPLACSAPSDVDTQSQATLERLEATARGLEDKAQRLELVVQRLESTRLEPLPRGEHARLPPSLAPGSATSPDLKDPFAKAGTDADQANADIQCEGEPCTIKRSVVDAVLDDPEVLRRQARVVPSRKDGFKLGFKLYGIRTTSLPHRLGLENGDLIKSLNGELMTSFATIEGLANELRKVDRIEIVGTRSGEPFTRSYAIVDG